MNVKWNPDQKRGHRNELRSRLLTQCSTITDQELIELVLFTAVARQDVKRTAKLLIEHFGSFGAAVSASKHELRENFHLNQATVAAFKTILAGAMRLTASAIPHGHRLQDSADLYDYLLTSISHRKFEHFIVFYFDAKSRLIGTEWHKMGFPSDVQADVRKIMRDGLILNACAMIIAHNHPSGDVTPSEADLEMTRYIKTSAKPIGIELVDHLIVGNGTCLSFRDIGLLSRGDKKMAGCQQKRSDLVLGK